MLPPEIIEIIRKQKIEQERRNQPEPLPLQIDDEPPTGWEPEPKNPQEPPRGVAVYQM